MAAEIATGEASSPITPGGLSNCGHYCLLRAQEIRETSDTLENNFMPPVHPSNPAEQQRISSTQAIMEAGHNTARYGDLLAAANLAAMAKSRNSAAQAARDSE
jgi:hypothetical protein